MPQTRSWVSMLLLTWSWFLQGLKKKITFISWVLLLVFFAMSRSNVQLCRGGSVPSLRGEGGFASGHPGWVQPRDGLPGGAWACCKAVFCWKLLPGPAPGSALCKGTSKGAQLQLRGLSCSPLSLHLVKPKIHGKPCRTEHPSGAANIG